MLLSHLLGTILVATSLNVGLSDQNPVQDAPPVQTQDAPATQLEDIVVSGRRLDDLISDFVGEVAEPNGDRGLARWDQTVCVGVVNLKAEPAQYIADRVSTVAEDLGLKPGQPGCAPNIMIVATSDSGQFAKDLVSRRERGFRVGGSGMDRGGTALRDFQETHRPVRWWQVSAPVDSRTGSIATRIPGQCQNDCSSPNDIAPTVLTSSAARLRTQIVDRLFRVIVIVDVDDVASLSISQLSDYIAMVSMAQVDPDADTREYASILNVFDQPDGPQYLTTWDRAYLGGLYNAEQNQTNRRSGRGEIASSIRDVHRSLVDDTETTPEP